MKKKKMLYVLIFFILIVILIGLLCLAFSNRNTKIGSTDFNLLGLEESNGISARFEVLSTNANQMRVGIDIRSQSGIETVTCPDSRVVYSNNKKQVGIDYDVDENGIYQFIVKTTDDEKTLTLDASKIIKISYDTSAIPATITMDGVQLQKEVTIDYADYEDKYYSIDGGNNWIEYTGPVKVKHLNTITAKGEKEDRINQIISRKVIITLATGSLSYEAYDGSLSTSVRGSNQNVGYLAIDPEMIGRTFSVKTRDGSYSGGVGGIVMNFTDANGDPSGSKSFSGGSNYGSVTIPNDSVKVTFRLNASSGWGGGTASYYLDEIRVP